MVFSSAVFLFLFLPVTVLVYYSPLCKSMRAKNVWLLLVSLGFYAWGEPVYILLMLLSILVNYAAGLLAERGSKRAQGRMVVTAACVFNLGLLFVFKYAAWLLRDVLGYDVAGTPFASLALPIGISFYTFQSLSYVIDVYRGGKQAQRNILDAGLYIAFFPQLIAGPIVRYGTVSEQIARRTHSFALFSAGVRRFIIGLSKKLLIANNVAVVVHHAFGAEMAERSVLFAWGGAFAFMLQIYFDFSGYSDMAIGLGKMFGFEFLENFDYPYTAKSIGEYWRRWHISLGQWFRDYLYYPLSTGPAIGLRKKLVGIAGRRGSGTIANVLVLFVVWFATGVWHGANLTFVLWGLVQFAFILWETHRKPLAQGKAAVCYAWISTFLKVLLAKVLFRADTLADALGYYRSLFHLAGNGWIDAAGMYFLGQFKVFLLAGFVFCFPVMEKIGAWCEATSARAARAWHIVQTVLLAVLFALDVSYAVGGGYNPFIYFNF